MRPIKTMCVVIALATAAVSAAGPTFAEDKKIDLSKGKDTVNRIREPDPPKVEKSTDTAKGRADREKTKEKEREKETARKYPPIKTEPPPPGK
jgi:hypothetical protein